MHIFAQEVDNREIDNGEIGSHQTGSYQLVIAGGVAANIEIGSRLKELAQEMSFDLFIPPAALCTDNAAMIAWTGHEYMAVGEDNGLDFCAATSLASGCRCTATAGARGTSLDVSGTNPNH